MVMMMMVIEFVGCGCDQKGGEANLLKVAST